MNNHTRNGYTLLHKYMRDVSKKLRRKLIYVVFGSLAQNGRGKYKHRKSDIDIVVIPCKGALHYKKFLWMNEHGKKYGEVFKNGRMIGIFDVMIIFDAYVQDNWRKAIQKNSSVVYYEVRPDGKRTKKRGEGIPIEEEKTKKE